MKLSNTRVNYGILVALDLALQQPDAPVQSKAIAKRQAIPTRFLEHILNAMRRAGLVESQRGAHGGYVLTKAPADVSLAQIVEALDGPLVIPRSSSARGGTAARRAPVQQLLLTGIWEQLLRAEQDLLNRMTLKELVEQYRALNQQTSPMYHI